MNPGPPVGPRVTRTNGASDSGREVLLMSSSERLRDVITVAQAQRPPNAEHAK